MKPLLNAIGNLALMLATTCLYVGCGGGAVVGALTVGGFLDNLGKQVNEAIDKAVGGADLVQIQAGGKISLAIQQAKEAYEGSLNRTMTELSSKDQEILNSLNSSVQQFRSGVATDVKKAEERALAIVHSLPFSKHFPRMYDYAPHFVIPPSVEHATSSINLEGDFTDLPNTNYVAKAKVGDKEVPNTAKSSNLCTFDIPYDLFVFSDNSLKANTLKIDIPYKTGAIISHQADTDFVLPIYTLPKTPGKVSIKTSTPTPTTIQQQVTSPEMVQDSSNDDIKDNGEHADLAIHRWSPDPGWQVVVNSVRYHITWSQGDEGVEKDWWFSRYASTINEAVACFSTEHHRFGTSGKIHFTISFTEQKDVTQNVQNTQDVAIKWGENRVVPIPSGSTWTGTYNRFDGKVQEFSGPYSDQFLKVTTTGPNVNLLADPEK